MKTENVHILIVEDNHDHAQILMDLLRSHPLPYTFSFTEAADAIHAMEAFKKATFDLVFIDYLLPEMNGLELLKWMQKEDSSVPIMVMTSFASIEKAVEAMRQGAFDYLTKPIRSFKNVILSIERALKQRALLKENLYLRQKVRSAPNTSFITGPSKAMKPILQVVDRVSKTDSTVLITGDSGTGKEVLAQEIHRKSFRKDQNFVAINCSTLPENLLDTELFGYVKGAFTGAHETKLGLIKHAHQGTFFLDEIAEVSQSFQTKLLRFLQEGEIRPTGSLHSEHLDVRVIAATNRNLQEEVKKGNFREDLFYRLNVIHLHLPRLEDRLEDIPYIAQHFIDRFNAREKRSVQSLTDKALHFLQSRAWPGNIRELKNLLDRALLFSKDEVLDVSAFLFMEKTLSTFYSEHIVQESIHVSRPYSYHQAKQDVLSQFTKTYLTQLLEIFSGNISLAAKKSGLGRQSFHRLLKDHGLDAKEFRKTNMSH